MPHRGLCFCVTAFPLLLAVLWAWGPPSDDAQILQFEPAADGRAEASAGLAAAASAKSVAAEAVGPAGELRAGAGAAFSSPESEEHTSGSEFSELGLDSNSDPQSSDSTRAAASQPSSSHQAQEVSMLGSIGKLLLEAVYGIIFFVQFIAGYGVVLLILGDLLSTWCPSIRDDGIENFWLSMVAFILSWYLHTIIMSFSPVLAIVYFALLAVMVVGAQDASQRRNFVSMAASGILLLSTFDIMITFFMLAIIAVLIITHRAFRFAKDWRKQDHPVDVFDVLITARPVADLLLRREDASAPLLLALVSSYVVASHTSLVACFAAAVIGMPCAKFLWYHIPLAPAVGRSTQPLLYVLIGLLLGRLQVWYPTIGLWAITLAIVGSHIHVWQYRAMTRLTAPVLCLLFVHQPVELTLVALAFVLVYVAKQLSADAPAFKIQVVRIASAFLVSIQRHVVTVASLICERAGARQDLYHPAVRVVYVTMLDALPNIVEMCSVANMFMGGAVGFFLGVLISLAGLIWSAAAAFIAAIFLGAGVNNYIRRNPGVINDVVAAVPDAEGADANLPPDAQRQARIARVMGNLRGLTQMFVRLQNDDAGIGLVTGFTLLRFKGFAAFTMSFAFITAFIKSWLFDSLTEHPYPFGAVVGGALIRILLIVACAAVCFVIVIVSTPADQQSVLDSWRRQAQAVADQEAIQLIDRLVVNRNAMFEIAVEGQPPVARVLARAAAAAGDDRAEPPAELCCPISQELFRDPCVTKYGNAFERQVIEEIIRNQGFDPLNNSPLNAAEIFPSKQLKELADAWRAAHPNFR